MSVNEQIGEELNKPVIKKKKKIKRTKFYARFKENSWAADLAEIESLYSNSKNT